MKRTLLLALFFAVLLAPLDATNSEIFIVTTSYEGIVNTLQQEGLHCSEWKGFPIFIATPAEVEILHKRNLPVLTLAEWDYQRVLQPLC